MIISYSSIIKNNRDFKKAKVFFFRSLLFYPLSLSWLKFIDSVYKKHNLVHASPEVASLLVRSYVGNNFSIGNRYALLKNHYNFLQQFFATKLVRGLLSGNKFNISQIATKDSSICYLGIFAHDKFWREGGLTLYFANSDNSLISTLTFSFALQNNEPIIIIGGLQGGSSFTKADIIKITRGLGGLRPKHMLLECCYVIANNFGISKIIGISDDNHVFSYKKATFSKNYNVFWQEVGGTLLPDKNYLLLPHLPKRDFESVPQKKRKDWLIRHGHIDKLTSDIKFFLMQNTSHLSG